ncbi:hypothetical protein [Deinococcus sp. QL22]|uniref:hypothetical protein n=1 Tax=Deinococcus sp. QL22 TaxID=2939437 RepID=UPI0020170D00|nr:hypothetical protein [Deinococcus sp. QL22]UQN09596.1 hypothetical protein M1R55_25965 [Deinococcus sp. QL22]
MKKLDDNLKAWAEAPHGDPQGTESSETPNTYIAPQVTPLGQWQVVTLTQSIPGGPGNFGFPTDNN